MTPEKQELNDEHYLRAVTELGDTRKIVSTCDIYARNGTKLVTPGVHITTELYERLVRHKLLAPIDQSLSIDDILTPKLIASDVLALIERNDTLRKISAIIDQGDPLHRILADIRTPPPLAFKLTVAKERFPHIYQHSLLMLLLSVYLARCDGMSPHEEVHIATAALLLDIGLLHIDPRLLEPSHVMSPPERRHLYAHPLTAYLLLREFPELPKQIANAVFEHHEKMDGSGYPRGLHGDKISRHGQILGVSVLAAKAFDSDNPHVPWKYLDVMLKLNAKKFGPGLIGHLNILHAGDDAGQTPASKVELLVERVRLISKLFEDFNRNANPPPHDDPAFEFAQARLAELQLGLLGAGFDPRDPDGLIQMFTDDPGCIVEFVPLISEAIWQFKSLVLEISRQWPEDAEKSKSEREVSDYAWLSEMRLLLTAAEMIE